MTKRSIERDIEDLSEELLGNLDPDERMRLALTAISNDKQQWIDRLRESCPTHQYVMTDPQYTKRVTQAMLFGHNAIYELATTALVAEHLHQQQSAQFVIDHYSEEPLDEEAIEAARDRADKLKNIVEGLYCRYYGYRRFAKEELGLSLEEWLGFHYEADTMLASIESFLDEQEFLLEKAADQHDDNTLDDLAEVYYRALAERWAEILEGIDA